MPSWNARAADAVVGHDRLGVAGAVRVHVVDRLLDGVDDPHGEDQGEELLAPVGLGRLRDRRVDRRAPARRRAARRRARAAPPERAGRNAVSHRRVHEQRLGRVARPRPLDLRVDDDPLGSRRDRRWRPRTRGSCPPRRRSPAPSRPREIAFFSPSPPRGMIRSTSALLAWPARRAPRGRRRRPGRASRPGGSRSRRLARDPRQHGVRVRGRRGAAQQHRVARTSGTARRRRS